MDAVLNTGGLTFFATVLTLALLSCMLALAVTASAVEGRQDKQAIISEKRVESLKKCNMNVRRFMY